MGKQLTDEDTKAKVWSIAMETEFRSFSLESKAPFPISLPLPRLPWHQESRGLPRAQWPDAHLGGANMTQGEKPQISTVFSPMHSVTPASAPFVSINGASFLLPGIG